MLKLINNFELHISKKDKKELEQIINNFKDLANQLNELVIQPKKEVK